MEIKSTIVKQRLVHFYLCVLLIVGCSVVARAQAPVKVCTIKNGEMFIALDRNLKEATLDSFIIQYDLHELGIKRLVKTGFADSLKKQGWQVSVEPKVVTLRKPLISYDNITNPAEKIIFTQKHPAFAIMFPTVSSDVRFGYNRFRNKYPFSVKGSVVRFFLRSNQTAKQVILSGSFNDWSTKGFRMLPTDSGWIFDLKLSPGKYWYKFIVDGNWTTDRDNLAVENDGLGNDNSVYFKPNTTFRLNASPKAKRVYLAASFNGWNSRQLLMEKTPSGWQLPLYVADGTHTYRFVVDRNWMPDPANPDKLRNEYNDYNSVLRIGKSYLFHLDDYANAKQVILSGSFNGWRKDELYMNKTAKGWDLLYNLAPGNYEYNFIVDGKKAKSADNGSGNLFFIIEPNQTFRLKGFENAKSVYIAGDFNGWAPNTYRMKREVGGWVFTAHLSLGKHLYKYVVDGRWITDPDNKLWEQNEHGTGNSVIWVEGK